MTVAVAIVIALFALGLWWLNSRDSLRFKVGKLIRITPGGRHAWYESNIGPLRKPFV
jgi:hypothetical protein